MGASNFRGQAPFLTYLTVFKSRLGVANIVLPLTGFAYQPVAALSRRLKEILSESISVDPRDPNASPILEYLVEKKLVGAEGRKSGRYTGFSLQSGSQGWQAFGRDNTALPKVLVYQTDMWLADPRIPSTIGVPTAENSDEILELCFQLNLLSKAKCTWTAAGQLTHGLRSVSPKPPYNPMVLALDGIALLRQAIEKDGLILRELLRDLQSQIGPINRDATALRLVAIAERALSAAQSLKMPPPVLAEGKKFVALLRKTAANRGSASRAPGVLEHRISPRLEWLTDWGALTKEGRPKNSFEYVCTPDALLLLKSLDGDPGRPYWSDNVAFTYWRKSSYWKTTRVQLQPIDLHAALRKGYRLMSRSVGPTPIREVCFAAGVLAPALTFTLEELSERLVEWAAQEQKITVSGGRYTRKPELVHMATDILGEG